MTTAPSKATKPTKPTKPSRPVSTGKPAVRQNAPKSTKQMPEGGPPQLMVPEPPAMARSLIEPMPVTREVMRLVQQIAEKLPALLKEMEGAHRGGAIKLARAFVVLHRLDARSDETMKSLGKIVDYYKMVAVPQALDQAGITNVPLDEGYRVGVSWNWRASIRPEMKDKAYDWLRRAKLGDIITSTVNASTLSATARILMEDQNRELPADLFNVAQMPNTSVTATK